MYVCIYRLYSTFIIRASPQGVATRTRMTRKNIDMRNAWNRDRRPKNVRNLNWERRKDGGKRDEVGEK